MGEHTLKSHAKGKKHQSKEPTTNSLFKHFNASSAASTSTNKSSITSISATPDKISATPDTATGSKSKTTV